MISIVLFHVLIILSYFFLPEGLLKNKNPLQDWALSDNTLLLTLQIFFYNLLSILIIGIGVFSQIKGYRVKLYLHRVCRFSP